MYRDRLEETLPRVRERIAAAARRVGRGDPDGVRIVPVTKGHGVEAVEAVLDAGLRDVAENRVEELEGKAEQIRREGIRWHMVGRLQRRKAPRVRGIVHLLHSLDSVRLAERLERTGPGGGAPLPVLLQVNVSGEDTKGGFEPGNLLEGLERVLGMGTLSVRGLMTMAPFTGDEAVLRKTFRDLRGLQEDALRRVPAYEGTELSMGMSNDFELAVEEGSTMVRLGTVLLGGRPE